MRGMAANLRSSELEWKIGNFAMNNLLTILIGAAAVAFVIAAVAFRAAWMAPSAAKLGYLPKSWQRWILGDYNRSR